MQELKLHGFGENHIFFKSVGDILIVNLVSMSAAGCRSNKYVIEKGVDRPGFDLQPVKVVSTF